MTFCKNNFPPFRPDYLLVLSEPDRGRDHPHHGGPRSRGQQGEQAVPLTPHQETLLLKLPGLRHRLHQTLLLLHLTLPQLQVSLWQTYLSI